MRYRWPDGKQSAAVLSFDFDAESGFYFREPEKARRSLGDLEERRFGPRVGVDRILRLLDRLKLRASFFIPAWVAEHHADAVRAIADGGHEIGCHGDEHERVSDLPPEREEAILLKSVEVLSRLGKTRPLGYRAPAWQLSAATVPLLVKHGFAYSSNMMDRLSPYLHPAVGGRQIVEIPVSWVLDDAPYFMFTGQRSIQPPGPVLQGWLTEFEGIAEARGVTNFTFHPQIIGRPSRLACLRELMDHVRHTPRVWIASLGEIAAHYRAALESSASAAG